jgi:ABC-type multidrug transport system ATPase subunit
MTDRSSTPAITVTALRKSFGEHTVLVGIDLEVAAGTFFSLLGPNGAGKTTAVNILTCTICRAARRVDGQPSCWSGSTWPTPPGGWRARTPVA